jgi:hypothetical protein
MRQQRKPSVDLGYPMEARRQPQPGEDGQAQRRLGPRLEPRAHRELGTALGGHLRAPLLARGRPVPPRQGAPQSPAPPHPRRHTDRHAQVLPGRRRARGRETTPRRPFRGLRDPTPEGRRPHRPTTADGLHQGRGRAAQRDSLESRVRGKARMRGSAGGGRKRPGSGTSPAAYPTREWAVGKGSCTRDLASRLPHYEPSKDDRTGRPRNIWLGGQERLSAETSSTILAGPPFAFNCAAC